MSLASNAVFYDSTDMDGENIPNRTTIEDFTEEIDEAGFVRQYNFFHMLMGMLCLCFALIVLRHLLPAW